MIFPSTWKIFGCYSTISYVRSFQQADIWRWYVIFGTAPADRDTQCLKLEILCARGKRTAWPIEWNLIMSWAEQNVWIYISGNSHNPCVVVSCDLKINGWPDWCNLIKLTWALPYDGAYKSGLVHKLSSSNHTVSVSLPNWQHQHDLLQNVSVRCHHIGLGHHHRCCCHGRRRPRIGERFRQRHRPSPGCGSRKIIPSAVFKEIDGLFHKRHQPSREAGWDLQQLWKSMEPCLRKRRKNLSQPVPGTMQK